MTKELQEELLVVAANSAAALDEAANLLGASGMRGMADIMRQQAERTREVIAKREVVG